MEITKTYRLDEDLIARIAALKSAYGSLAGVIGAAITMLENATIEASMANAPLPTDPIPRTEAIGPPVPETRATPPEYQAPVFTEPRVIPRNSRKESWAEEQERKRQAQVDKIAASDTLAVLMDRKDIVYDPEP